MVQAAARIAQRGIAHFRDSATTGGFGDENLEDELIFFVPPPAHHYDQSDENGRAQQHCRN
jgi:hypothetical protein